MLTWRGRRPRPHGRLGRPSLHKHVTIFRMKLLGALIATLILNLCVQAQSVTKAVTVPITLDHNRTIIDVYLTLPDGKTKRVRAWVDNGSAELWMTDDLAKQLGLSFKGVSSKLLLDSKNGLIQVPSKIEGQEFNLALDVGASITLLSGEQIAQWHKAEPSWPYMIGGVAAGNMWGSEEEARWPMLRIPSIQFGAATLSDVAAASFPDEELKWFQNRAGVATMGLVGANALLDDRVGIDYAHSTVYMERTNRNSAPDMNVVGLMLRPEADRRYTIIGVADNVGKPPVPEVKVGDVLVGVDGAPATGATMGQVWSLLGGTPGQVRTLTLEREGKRFTVDAPVRRFLAGEPTPVKSPRKNPHKGN